MKKRQKQIVEEAINLIATNGIQALTIKNLANAIGVTEPAIYRHFDSKIDIILSILDFFEQESRVLFQLCTKKPPLKELECIFLKRVRSFKENPAFASVIFAEEIFRDKKELTEKIQMLIGLYFQKFSSLLRDAQQKQTIRTDIDAEQLTLLTFGVLRLIVTQWRLSNFSFDIEKKSRYIWKTLEKIFKGGHNE